MSSFIEKLGFSNKSKPKEVTEKRVIKEVKSILVIVVIVFAFRSSFFEPFKIPSGSMIPTLMIGDFILVNKLSYGIKVPFSDMYSDPIYLAEFSGPKRGDVIVFKYPLDENINYIKRVIGLPGDKIEMTDKILYINDVQINAEPMSEEAAKAIQDDLEFKFQTRSFKYFTASTGDKKHTIILDDDGYHSINLSPFTVPQGKYFVMGDNRDFSSDSRMWGFVDHRLVKGKALFVWFSSNLPFFGSEHEFKFRPSRIGHGIN